MTTVRFATILFSLLLLMIGQVQADTTPNPREKLQTAIPEGIRLLETKEYITFLKNFANPSDLEQFTKENSLEEGAKVFAEEKAQRLLEILKEIQDVKPKFENNGNKAIFQLKDNNEGMHTIIFVRVERYWYIQNKPE